MERCEIAFPSDALMVDHFESHAPLRLKPLLILGFTARLEAAPFQSQQFSRFSLLRFAGQPRRLSPDGSSRQLEDGEPDQTPAATGSRMVIFSSTSSWNAVWVLATRM